MLFKAKMPKILQKIFPSLVWKCLTNEKKVWLTFDDGPNPKVTDYILKVLKKNNIKATFFCVGNKIEKYPDIINKIKQEGHIIGNHSYSHINGFKTSTKKYIKDISKCQELIPNTKIFRPPFGKITPIQISKLKQDFKIIMWDVMAYDFRDSLTKEECLLNVTDNVESGSIIVLHDNLKSFEKIKYILPKIIDKLKDRKFNFSEIW
jgi:peptidoglycan/xylan/chitin deacetylase (PgdA/CDA1 family)